MCLRPGEAGGGHWEGGNVGWGEAFTGVTDTQTLSRHNIKTDGEGEGASRQKMMMAAQTNGYLVQYSSEMSICKVALLQGITLMLRAQASHN